MKDKYEKVKDELNPAFRQLQEKARKVAKIMEEARIEVDHEDFVNAFNPSLMDVCLEWVNGAKFVDIMKLTDSYEGSIIRIIRRLEELLRQLALAARAIGNQELETKFNDGREKIKRGIIFAASLYL